jgi:hypothetical protein
VAIIDRGHIQRIVSVRESAGQGTARRWRIRVAQAPEALVAQLPGASMIGPDVECTADVAALNAALAAAISQGTLIVAVAPAESSLEEAFRSAVTVR